MGEETEYSIALANAQASVLTSKNEGKIKDWNKEIGGGKMAM